MQTGWGENVWLQQRGPGHKILMALAMLCRLPVAVGRGAAEMKVHTEWIAAIGQLQCNTWRL